MTPPSTPPAVERDLVYERLLRLLVSHVAENGALHLSTQTSFQSRRRLAHQIISALISSGIPQDATVIQRLFDRLIHAQKDDAPRESPDEHYIVLDKIEAAIDIGKTGHEFLKTALPLLLKRQRREARFDVPNEPPGPFLWLWIAKILVKHPDHKSHSAVIDGIIEPSFEGRNILSARDLSMLIWVAARHWRERPHDLARLSTLVDTLADLCHGGLFDANDNIRSRIDDLKQFGLVPDVVVGIAADVYHCIISTCYVISNLCSIRDSIPSLPDKLSYSAAAVYSIVGHAGTNLSTAFGNEYQEIMLAARTIIALSDYTGDAIANNVLPILMKRIVDMERQESRDIEQREKAQLQGAIKHWLRIDWSKEDQARLGGGYSGARVVRIKPKIFVPADAPNEAYEVTIPHLDSAIVKYGRKLELDFERRNFLTIPPEYRSAFATIPTSAYQVVVDGEVIEYLLIEDLLGFRTLEEVLVPVADDFAQYLIDKLDAFLRFFYSMPAVPHETIGIIRSLYLSPMYRSLDTIHELLQRTSRFSSEDLEVAKHLHQLFGYSEALDKFPVTVMHGDLNIRNLLMHGPQKRGAELRFRFIDMDKFTRTGDVAFDIGEFVIDTRSVQVTRAANTGMLVIADAIEQSFRQFADARRDVGFPLRLELAKARSILKIVEIRSRTGVRLASADAISRKRASVVADEIRPALCEAYSVLRSTADRLVTLEEESGGRLSGL